MSTVISQSNKDWLLHSVLCMSRNDNYTEGKVKTLIDEGANINFITPGAKSTLMIAIINRNIDMLLLLLNHGADPNIISSDPEYPGYTPIHTAVKLRNDEALLYLLEHGADPDKLAQDESALHLATIIDNQDAVTFLLQHGANIKQSDELGRTPFSLAVDNFRPAIVDILLKDPNLDMNDDALREAVERATSIKHHEAAAIISQHLLNKASVSTLDKGDIHIQKNVRARL